jgi:hypothetical protein
MPDFTSGITCFYDGRQRRHPASSRTLPAAGAAGSESAASVIKPKLKAGRRMLKAYL